MAGLFITPWRRNIFLLPHVTRSNPRCWQPGAKASLDRPLAHLSMEADGGDGAALALRLWAGGMMREWRLGRADFHARWIDWQPKEI